MMNDYKRAMDRIKTDDAYKAEFLKSLESAPAPKKTRTRSLRRSFSYISSAAAVLLVFYCTVLFFMRQPDDSAFRMQSDYQSEAIQTSETVSTNVVYFTFEGFEEYETQPRSKAVLIGELDKDCTVASFLNDYYQVITDNDGSVVITDGMVDSFLDVQVDGEKEINIYINDREVMNLDKERVSDSINSENDVYFRVSIVE